MVGEPFGKPFAYTDPYDLQTQYDRAKPKRPWYKRWRKQRLPFAWALVETVENKPVVAYVLNDKDHSFARVGGVQVPAALPVYDETVIFDAKWEPDE